MTARDSGWEEQAAERLDQAIDWALGQGGRPDADPELDRLLRHLAVLHQPPVPPRLRERIAADRQAGRPGRRPLRWLAGLLGAILLGQAITLFFAGEWLSGYLGLLYEPHIYREQAILYMAVALGLLLGAFRPACLQGGLVAVTASMGLMLGLYGLSELPHSPNPAAELLHLVQGVLAGTVGWLWYRTGRF